MTNTSINNKTPFDKIYCLHITKNKERYEHCIEEFKKVNIIDNVNFWWTIETVINTKIGKLFEDNYRSFEAYKYKDDDTLGRVYSCSMGHYEIVKTSYERGFENILIFEDDISFDNEDSFKILCDIYSKKPTDCECLKFYYYYGNKTQYNKDFKDRIKCKKDSFINLYWLPTPSCLCYALTRDGMKKIIDIYESEGIPVVADQIQWKLKCYGPTYDISHSIVNDKKVHNQESSIEKLKKPESNIFF